MVNNLRSPCNTEGLHEKELEEMGPYSTTKSMVRDAREPEPDSQARSQPVDVLVSSPRSAMSSQQWPAAAGIIDRREACPTTRGTGSRLVPAACFLLHTLFPCRMIMSQWVEAALSRDRQETTTAHKQDAIVQAGPGTKRQYCFVFFLLVENISPRSLVIVPWHPWMDATRAAGTSSSRRRR